MITGSLIVRWGKPSKHDQLSYGTICQSLGRGDSFDIYVQMNEDDSNPLWEMVGTFSPKTQDLIMEEVNRLLNLKQVR